jgi:hypothetical protein
MRSFLFVLIAIAACCSASAEVMLNIPSQIVPPSRSAIDLSLDLGFVLTAPDVSQDLVGYDLFLQVTGGNGLSITGAGAGSDLLGADPVYLATTDSAGDTLYYFGDFALSGAGTISNGSLLLQVDAQLPAGATGTDQIAAYVNPPGSQTTAFYSGVNGTNLIPIAGMGFQSGAVTVTVPGDANLDGQVDINDLTIVLANYNQTGMVWFQGGFTGSGTVDINDLTIVLANYHASVASAARMADVPEPAGIMLLLAGAACLFGFARHTPAVPYGTTNRTTFRTGRPGRYTLLRTTTGRPYQ